MHIVVLYARENNVPLDYITRILFFTYSVCMTMRFPVRANGRMQISQLLMGYYPASGTSFCMKKITGHITPRRKRRYKGIMTRIKNNYLHDCCLKVGGIWKNVIFGAFVNHKWNHRCGSVLRYAVAILKLHFREWMCRRIPFASRIISLFTRENATPFCYFAGKSVIINVYTI